mmetsp:Transcript_6541/g.16885  ORF Transcript_6541/g.16885 Transcript_6541/m.16885 type:complete len:252 (-) Transcript_6541:467-1222(-)
MTSAQPSTTSEPWARTTRETTLSATLPRTSTSRSTRTTAEPPASSPASLPALSSPGVFSSEDSSTSTSWSRSKSSARRQLKPMSSSFSLTERCNSFTTFTTNQATKITQSSVLLMKLLNLVTLLYSYCTFSRFSSASSSSLIFSGSLVSHSISYTVPHSYFVSSNSIFRPSQAKTSLTFLKPPKHLSPLTSNLLKVSLSTPMSLSSMSCGLSTNDRPRIGSTSSSISEAFPIPFCRTALPLTVTTHFSFTL